ncbi:MAG: phage terminase large subunit [Alphaproteobacteria bacterium]|nr:phage terminase large subunit [Alphaproteobacteria bacterium]
MTTAVQHRLDTSRIPAQRKFMESQASELLYSGAFAAGKSRIGCEKGLFLCLRYPGTVGVIMRKTFTSLRYTTMETFFRDVIPPELMARSSYNKVTNILTLPNQSRIFFLGIDEPLKIGGLEAGWIYVDEIVELNEDDYIMVLGRCRLTKLVGGEVLPFRQVFGTTNPGAPSHWLYQRAFVEGKIEIVESSTLDNPFLPPDYIEVLKGFTGRYRDRYVLGKWVGFEGLVYDNWDPATHWIEPFDIPVDWPRFRTIDFGFTNPFGCGWWAQVPPGKEEEYKEQGWKGFYLYREIYMSQRTVEVHARDIVRYSRDDPAVTATFSDWDSGDRAILEKNGVPTVAAKKDISSGIQEVYQAIDDNRIRIFKNSLVERDQELVNAKLPTCTVEEFPNYQWAEVPTGKNQKEIPRDKDNHGMDMVRYLIYSLGGRGSVQQVYTERRAAPRVPARSWGLMRGTGGRPRSWMRF